MDDDIKALRIKLQQSEDEYQATRVELDEIR